MAETFDVDFLSILRADVDGRADPTRTVDADGAGCVVIGSFISPPSGQLTLNTRPYTPIRVLWESRSAHS